MSNIKNKMAEDEGDDYNFYIHALGVLNGTAPMPDQEGLLELLRESIAELEICLGFVKDFNAFLTDIENQQK